MPRLGVPSTTNSATRLAQQRRFAQQRPPTRRRLPARRRQLTHTRFTPTRLTQARLNAERSPYADRSPYAERSLWRTGPLAAADELSTKRSTWQYSPAYRSTLILTAKKGRKEGAYMPPGLAVGSKAPAFKLPHDGGKKNTCLERLTSGPGDVAARPGPPDRPYLAQRSTAPPPPASTGNLRKINHNRLELAQLAPV